MANKSDKVRKNTREREGIPQKAPFPASTCEEGCKYLRGRLHVLAGKVACISVEDEVHCLFSCKALQPPSQTFAVKTASFGLAENTWEKGFPKRLGIP